MDLSVRGIFCRLIAAIIDQNNVYRSKVIFGSFASKCKRIYGEMIVCLFDIVYRKSSQSGDRSMHLVLTFTVS